MKSNDVASLTIAVVVAWSLTYPAWPASTQKELERVPRDALCVTNGEIGVLANDRLTVESPSSRAVLRNMGGNAAEIRFRYLGPTQSSKPLASGEMRRQIGIKLNAQDTCNLLYVMWHIEPDSRIAVSVKRNPGMRTHEQCGAHGYVNVKATVHTQAQKVTPGSSHVLRADLEGDELTVTADGVAVWRGALGRQLDGLSGPVGLRTDNAHFEFEFLAGGAISPTESPRAPTGSAVCASSSGD